MTNEEVKMRGTYKKGNATTFAVIHVKVKYMNWIILGIGASILWGVYTVILKISTSEQYYNTSPRIALLGLMMGGFIATAVLLAVTRHQPATFPRVGFTAAVGAGILWALGMIFVTYALGDTSTPVSKLVPLYNTNTLIAVLIGILLLKEVPEERVKTIVGAMFIIVGGILLSR